MIKPEHPYKIYRRLINPPNFNDLKQPNPGHALTFAPTAPTSTSAPASGPALGTSIDHIFDLRTRELLQGNIDEMNMVIAASTRQKLQDEQLF